MVNNDFPVTVEAGAAGSGPPTSALPGALLTVAEVARLMRVSNMTVYRLIKAGDLAAVRVGHSYRIREGEIGRYLAARSVRVEGA
jgi:excisionase family DNA binding protein